MLTSGPGKRLTLYLGESDSWRGGSLYMSILETLRASSTCPSSSP
jgi:PII-like signaling protein